MSSSGSKDALSDQEQAALNLQMGTRYLDMGMLQVAKEKLEKARELDSGNANIYNALAVLHERIEQFGAAREYYQEALALDPDNPSSKNNYGRFLCEQGNYSEGVVLLEQTVQMPLNNRKWIAFTNLGLCYVQLNQSEQAERAFRQALELQPDYAPALLEMQRISYQQRNYMSARAFLERYLGVSQHTPKTLWIAVQTERALGNRKLVEKYQQQLLTLFPGSEQAQQVRTAVNR
nr:type IV pilus biogenesis/stability protein PilW [Methylomarinum sp. Ch1-1]MDP4519319.1 type IV pilus biogenesis/stability protein PilW [Methylomarinum sp. Ch1-1]